MFFSIKKQFKQNVNEINVSFYYEFYLNHLIINSLISKTKEKKSVQILAFCNSFICLCQFKGAHRSVRFFGFTDFYRTVPIFRFFSGTDSRF